MENKELISGELDALKPVSNTNMWSGIIQSLDILRDNIMIRGWDENSGKKIQDILDIYNNSKIRGIHENYVRKTQCNS